VLAEILVRKYLFQEGEEVGAMSFWVVD